MAPELPDPSFAKIVVLTDSPASREALKLRLRKAVAEGLASEARVRVTQAFRNGADAHAIMRQTGHTTPAMVETYAHENAPLVGNAVTELGL